MNKYHELYFINSRLPKNIFPVHYKLYINPNLDDFTFDGTVEINIKFENHNNSMFAIHMKDLSIVNILFDKNYVTKYEIDRIHDLLIIDTGVVLNTSEHKLKIIYYGKINDRLKGFYRSKYIINDEEKYIATTQFESTDARTAFPCFDEPSFKSTFDIIISTMKNKTVLSNTSVKTIEYPNENTQIVTFETTPVMSTYIVAFIIGDFDYIERIVNGVKIRVYATENYKSKMEFPLEITVHALNWFEKWFDVKYELNKLDMIGIPDFSAGAMENWGLITFRPELLFCDKYTNLSVKQSVVTTICHELAHQWFGNLVTIEWWTYLWLNESMATYFGWFVCDQLFPEWNVWKKFIDDEYDYALNIDSLRTSHPIEVSVDHPNDINEIFDGISYSKGACLIRFLVNYLGENIFRLGMQKYIKTNKYSNTVSDDLWDSFDFIIKNNPQLHTNAVGITSIRNIMNSWIKQTGYPIVKVTSQNNNSILLSQQKYHIMGPIDDAVIWVIPVKIYIENSSNEIENETEQFHVMKSDKYIFQHDGQNFIINPNRLGFFRVQYDNESYNFELLSASMKNQILSDNISLSLSGYQGLSNVIKTINKINLLELEEHELWNTIITGLSTIRKLLVVHADLRAKLDKYINNNILPYIKIYFKKIGWNDVLTESSNISNLRPLFINFLGVMNDEETISYAKQIFETSDMMKINNNILTIIGRNATTVEYSKLLHMFKNEMYLHSKEKLMSAICSVTDINLINDILNNVLFQKVRDQDIWILVQLLSRNEFASNVTWNFITENWNKILTIYKPGSSGLSHIIKGLSYGIYTRDDENKFKLFFREIPDGTNMTINQCIEYIDGRISSINRIINDEEFQIIITL